MERIHDEILFAIIFFRDKKISINYLELMETHVIDEIFANVL